MKNSQYIPSHFDGLELNWKAAYCYFLPEIVEIYKLKYATCRDQTDFRIPDSQQPYELNTSRYDDAFWKDVFQEHCRYGVSFDQTWEIFMTKNGCGTMPWPDMMRRAPEAFDQQGLYGKSVVDLLGVFSYNVSDDQVRSVIDHVANGLYKDYHTICLSFLLDANQWIRLTDPEVRIDIADYLEQHLSFFAAKELEKYHGQRLQPFFDWIATWPFRDQRT